MGYSIYIGEATIETDERFGDNAIYLTVKKTEQEDAPFWESSGVNTDISGKTNGRHPSYSNFNEFCNKTGLNDLFFDESNGLMRDHPGCFLIRASDLESIKLAREQWELKYPGSIPGWENGKDADLARLIWFEWWFEWALSNCKVPSIYNL